MVRHTLKAFAAKVCLTIVRHCEVKGEIELVKLNLQNSCFFTLNFFQFSNFPRFQSFKRSIRYMFASLFCKFKGEHLWSEEKYFLFNFEISFRSWDNQILTFQILKCHDVIKYPNMKHEKLYWISWEVNTVW